MTLSGPESFDRDTLLTLVRQGDFERAEPSLAQARERHPQDTEIAIAYARSAHQRGDWPAALARWEYVRVHFPDELAGFQEGLSCLVSAGRGGDIELLCAEAVQRFPQADRFAVEFAWQAHHRRDWALAEARWKELRMRFPGHLQGYLGGAYSFTLSERHADADALLAEGLEREAGHRELLLAFARQAQQRGDLDVAVERWARLREMHPGDPIGYSGGAICLFDMGRSVDADHLLASAVERLPEQRTLATEYARMARRRGDHIEAVRRWALVREKFPNEPDGYLEAAALHLDDSQLTEAEALYVKAFELFPENFSVASAWAESASRRQEWDESERRWEQVRVRFPMEPLGYERLAWTLGALGRNTDAVALLDLAQQRFPGHVALAAAIGHQAMERKSWLEAVNRWADMRRRFPNDVRGYVGGSRALAELLRFDESDALLEQSLKAFPDSQDLLFTWAHLSPRSKPAEEVLSRWQRFRERFPGHPAGYTFGTWYLGELGRPAEAEALAQEAMQRFTLNADVARTWAEAALRRGDIPLAAARFQEALARHPSDLRTVQQLAAALVTLRRNDELASLLEDARLKWPHDSQLLRHRIGQAKEANDLESAFVIWNQIANDKNIDRAVRFDLSWYLFTQDLPPEYARQILLYLGNEADTGAPDWLPRVAGIVHFGGKLRETADFARALVNAEPPQSFHPATLLVLKRNLSIPLSQQNIHDLFSRFVAGGRIAMTAHMFSENYWRLDPGRFDEITRLFEAYMAEKWVDTSWLREGNETEILFYLIFAAVFSHSEYYRLISAAKQNLVLTDNQALTTPASIVSSMASRSRVATGASRGLGASSPSVAGRRLRIALCISGQLRGYAQAYPSWSKLNLQDHEVTRFVHVWKDIGRNWRRIWSFTAGRPRLYGTLMGKEVIPFLRLRYPRLAETVIAADASDRELMDFYQTQFVRLEDDKSDVFLGMQNVSKMHYKIHQAHSFALEDSRKFDIMIRIRPDFEIVRNDPVDWGEIYERVSQERIVLTDLPLRYVHEKLELGDQVCIAAPDVMEVYANLLPDLDAQRRAGQWPFGVPSELASHVQLGMMTLYRGILSEQLPLLKGSMLRDPSMPSVEEILSLLKQDIAGRELDGFDQEFVGACEQMAKNH